MNQQQLECFLQVADTLSFARAAKMLNLSQPAVSRQINSLESELGVKLFTRNTRNVILTSYGQSFYADAKDIHNRMLAVTSRIHSDGDLYVPLLHIGFCSSSDEEFLTWLLDICRRKLPEIHPYLQIMPRKRLLNMLLKDNLEAVFGFKEDFQQEQDLVYLPLFEVNVCCVISAKHPFASKEEISMEELYQERVIFNYVSDMPSSIISLQKQLEYRYTSANLYYTDDIAVTLAFIRAGYGYSILADLKSEHDKGIACVPLRGVPPLSYGIYYRKNRDQSKLFRAFLKLFKR